MQNHTASRLSPEFVLLGYLYKFPDHGYTLHKRLINEFGYIWHASQSQTYNIIKRLKAQGYVAATQIEQEKLPARQLVNITPAGVIRFENWLESPTNPSVHAIRVEFITRLYFTQLYRPQKVGEMIAEQIGSVDGGLTQLQQDLSEVRTDQPFNRLALELRIKLLGSVKSWLEECRSKPGKIQAGGNDE